MSWPIAKLGDILSDAELFTDGDWVESKDQDKFGNVRLIQLADIGDGYYIDKSSRFLNEETFKRLRCTEIIPGDILIARMPDPLGRACIFPGDAKKSVTVVDVCIIRPNKQVVDAKWLTHTLNSVSVRKQISGLAKGATRVRISRKDFGTIQLPFPPLPEQKRIAAIVDKADELKRKREAAIAKLDQLAQSIFVEMFGDSITNKLHWPEKQLGDITVGKPNNGIFKKNEEYSEGLPVAWVEELFRGDKLELDNSRHIAPTKEELEKYGLDYGDILFCRSSLKLDGIGFNNVYLGIKNHALFECHLIRIKPNKDLINPIFLNFMLRTPAARQNIKKQAKTVTMTTIDQDGLLRTKIILPPLTLQNKFADIFQKIVGLKLTNMRQLERAKLLFASLQHQAFAGQL